MTFTQEDFKREFERACKMYEEQLDQFGRMMKPKTKETLISGFKDGLGYGLRLLLTVAKETN